MIESKIISLEDFSEIGKQHKFWLWHLVEKNHNPFLELQPLSVQMPFHVMFEISTKTEIPIFETVIYDVLDHILYEDDTILQKLKNKKRDKIGPVVLGYNHQRFVSSTLHNCYCSGGVLEILGQMNPELLLKFDLG